MGASYLTEAFKSLDILDEEDFSLSSNDDLKRLTELDTDTEDDVIEIMNMPVDDAEDIIDVDAESDTHIGDVIFDCPVCHSKIYRSHEDVILNDEETLANVGEECPYCYTADGFKIVGQVAPYEPEDDIQVEIEDKVEDDDDSEEEKIDVDESLNRGSRKIKESKEVDLAEYQKWVDYDMKKYRKISKDTMKKIKQAGLSVVKDQYGDYEVIAARPDSDNQKYSKTKSTNKELTEKQWRYSLRVGQRLRSAIDEGDIMSVKNYLKDAYTELLDADIIDEDDYDIYVEELEYIDDTDKDEIDFQLSEFYDLCDNLDVWIPLNESKQQARESFEKVELETDNQKITVRSEPRENEGFDNEMIVPVDSEIKDEIEQKSDEESMSDENENEISDEDITDVDISEFDEESFNDLGESYLKKVYENVRSYKTVRITENENKLIVEGIISFNSGKTKPTTFIFEGNVIDKSNNLKFVGENKQITRGKKSFTLNGRLNNKKFISESLRYNYRAKDTNGVSTRVYGTVRTK